MTEMILSLERKKLVDVMIERGLFAEVVLAHYRDGKEFSLFKIDPKYSAEARQALEEKYQQDDFATLAATYSTYHIGLHFDSFEDSSKSYNNALLYYRNLVAKLNLDPYSGVPL